MPHTPQRLNPRSRARKPLHSKEKPPQWEAPRIATRRKPEQSSEDPMQPKKTLRLRLDFSKFLFQYLFTLVKITDDVKEILYGVYQLIPTILKIKT